MQIFDSWQSWHFLLEFITGSPDLDGHGMFHVTGMVVYLSGLGRAQGIKNPVRPKKMAQGTQKRNTFHMEYVSRYVYSLVRTMFHDMFVH